MYSNSEIPDRGKACLSAKAWDTGPVIRIDGGGIHLVGGPTPDSFFSDRASPCPVRMEGMESKFEAVGYFLLARNSSGTALSDFSTHNHKE